MIRPHALYSRGSQLAQQHRWLNSEETLSCWYRKRRGFFLHLIYLFNTAHEEEEGEAASAKSFAATEVSVQRRRRASCGAG